MFIRQSVLKKLRKTWIRIDFFWLEKEHCRTRKRFANCSKKHLPFNFLSLIKVLQLCSTLDFRRIFSISFPKFSTRAKQTVPNVWTSIESFEFKLPKFCSTREILYLAAWSFGGFCANWCPKAIDQKRLTQSDRTRPNCGAQIVQRPSLSRSPTKFSNLIPPAASKWPQEGSSFWWSLGVHKWARHSRIYTHANHSSRFTSEKAVTWREKLRRGAHSKCVPKESRITRYLKKPKAPQHTHR